MVSPEERNIDNSFDERRSSNHENVDSIKLGIGDDSKHESDSPQPQQQQHQHQHQHQHQQQQPVRDDQPKELPEAEDLPAILTTELPSSIPNDKEDISGPVNDQEVIMVPGCVLISVFISYSFRKCLRIRWKP
jgi:hypothetical protein